MLNAKRSLSQNYLIDNNIRKKIVKLTNITNKNVLEIGPGYGFLTNNILEKNPKKLYLVEKDNELLNLLKKKYNNNNKVIFIEDDIFKLDFNNFNNLIIISNLPYNIGTKIILYLFNFNNNISEMIFMLQKEVALKFDYNLPNMNKYKFLTKVVSNFKRCFNVSSNVFIPRPKVNSTVVKFNFKKEKCNLSKAVNFSNAIFKNVRKKINNNIKIRKNNALLSKRVNELSINDLLKIYNSF